MFSKDYELYSEGADLSNIQEAEGYDNFDSIVRIVSENYENQIMIEEYMNRCDAKERRMIAEGASQEEIDAFVETSVGGVYTYLKGVMQRFWAKIKAFFTKMIRKVKIYMAKRLINKYRENKSKIDKYFKKIGGYSENEKAYMLNNFCAARAIGEVKCSFGDILKLILGDTSKINLKDVNKLVFGVANEDFREVEYTIHSSWFEEPTNYNLKSDKAGRAKVLETIKLFCSDESQASLKGLLAGIERYTKKVIEALSKRSELKGDAELNKSINKKVSIFNNALTRLSSLYFKEHMFGVSQASKAVNFILSKYSVVVAANESYSFDDADVINDGIEII